MEQSNPAQQSKGMVQQVLPKPQVGLLEPPMVEQFTVT
jgi:hypothetical protein